MEWRGGGQGDNLIRHREGLPWRRYKTQSLDWNPPAGGLLSSVALYLSLSLYPEKPTPSRLRSINRETPKCQVSCRHRRFATPSPFFAPASPVTRRTSTRPTLMRIVEDKHASLRYEKKDKGSYKNCTY